MFKVCHISHLFSILHVVPVIRKKICNKDKFMYHYLCLYYCIKYAIYCVRYTHELFIQLTVCNISVVQCMQFTSSYDKECYNEHEFMYHFFCTIA